MREDNENSGVGRNEKRSELRDWSGWLLAAAITTACLALIATHIPARLKLLLVFPIVIGLLHAAVLARLHDCFPSVPRSFVMGVGSIFATAALVSQTMMTYERERDRFLAIELEALEHLSRENLSNGVATGSALGLATESRNEFLEEQGSFSAYLEKRLKLVDDSFSVHDPERFSWGRFLWLSELVSGTLGSLFGLSIWCARLTAN